MKKAFKWLEGNNIEFTFHDYRKDGISEAMVAEFVSELGIDKVLNTRGTTWRKLPDDIKESLDDAGRIKLLAENEAMIKRPIFDLGNCRVIGFSKKEQADLETALLK